LSCRVSAPASRPSLGRRRQRAEFLTRHDTVASNRIPHHAILFLCAVLAFPPSAAIAADVTLENTAPPTVADQPVFTWSGAYFGLHAGGGWTNGEFSGLGITGYEDANGGLLGAFAGYNYPLDNSVVAGFEGDIEHHWNEQNVFG
jgi:outer membrane immunogenic protein